ncbi:hypothetical protein B0F90DRAFT_1360538 [Multifurca ochricompacta]|uniref:Uncharacterized protein n=1 Tax=Multifurca ochricompacta TaxID=376703 RepID=A0AAD4QPG8_9AGAM|nr:hypothetical protein B0F90DRAFT_1360538 [Multifurca ochricompacta]
MPLRCLPGYFRCLIGFRSLSAVTKLSSVLILLLSPGFVYTLQGLAEKDQPRTTGCSYIRSQSQSLTNSDCGEGSIPWWSFPPGSPVCPISRAMAQLKKSVYRNRKFNRGLRVESSVWVKQDGRIQHCALRVGCRPDMFHGETCWARQCNQNKEALYT